MPIRSQAGNNKANAKRNRWDETIEYAERRIRELREAIRVFRARRAAGDPWPGDKLLADFKKSN